MFKKIALVVLILLFGGMASAQGPELPPKAEGERHMIFPPGFCDGLVEVGTWKKELSEAAGFDIFWAKSPRILVEPCTILALPEFVAKYRIAARCVKRDNHNVYSSWVRSMSGEKKPWPELGPDPEKGFGCLGFAPGQPINPELCPIQ